MHIKIILEKDPHFHTKNAHVYIVMVKKHDIEYIERILHKPIFWPVRRTSLFLLEGCGLTRPACERFY